MRSPPEREVIPEELAPGDPCAGDEALFEAGDFTNFVRFGGTLDQPAWAKAERAFHDRVLAVLQGEAPWTDPELLRLAALLRVDHAADFDTRPPRVAEQAVPDEVLSDIVEDLLPDYAVLTERITGDDRAPSVPVVAALAFVPATADGRRPLDWWGEEEDDRALVRSSRVIDASAPGIYRDGVPLLACHPRRVPEGPAPRGVYVGRAYRVEAGWAWSCCVPLPRVPDIAVVERRLRLEAWRHRCLERRASTDDVLRAHPEVLYRAACEGASAG
jgi:hypothetical protein